MTRTVFFIFIFILTACSHTPAINQKTETRLPSALASSLAAPNADTLECLGALAKERDYTMGWPIGFGKGLSVKASSNYSERKSSKGWYKVLAYSSYWIEPEAIYAYSELPFTTGDIFDPCRQAEEIQSISYLKLPPPHAEFLFGGDAGRISYIYDVKTHANIGSDLKTFTTCQYNATQIASKKIKALEPELKKRGTWFAPVEVTSTGIAKIPATLATEAQVEHALTLVKKDAEEVLYAYQAGFNYLVRTSLEKKEGLPAFPSGMNLLDSPACKNSDLMRPLVDDLQKWLHSCADRYSQLRRDCAY